MSFTRDFLVRAGAPRRALRLRPISRTGASMLATVALFALFIAAFPSNVPAHAAEPHMFNPGNIISDAVFFNSQSMSSREIQSFLDSKMPACARRSQPCLKDFSMATQTKEETRYCSRYEGRANESAAEIIHRVGLACGINPQVIMVTLQKERGLVTKRSPTTGDYQISLGFACPDDAPCDEEYYGFFNQIYHAASQFQRYTQNAGDWRYQAGRMNTILYSPNSSCGASEVFIENQATANLYIYTPYQANEAALGNLYGIGDGCSAYGNRNFWVFFTDWFGNPSGFQSGSFENGIAGWQSGNGPINQAIYTDPSVARDGKKYLAMSTPVAGRSLSQDVSMRTVPGDKVRLRLSLRSGTSRSFSGTVAVWGLGGETEVVTRSFTVADSWNDLDMSFFPDLAAHSGIRIEIYMNETNRDLLVDAASIETGTAPVKQNLLQTPSFENSFAHWEASNGALNQQIYNSPDNAYEGSWFAAISTPVVGRSLSQNVNVYGAQSNKYRLSVHIRAADPALPVRGELALWGFSESGPVASHTWFDAGTDWSLVGVALDPTGKELTSLRAEIYLENTGRTLLLDDAVVGVDVLTNPSFDNGTFDNWEPSNNDVNRSIYRASEHDRPFDGSYYAATNTPRSGESIRTNVTLTPRAGGRYTARLWVRTPESAPFDGKLALWGLGSGNEVASVDFRATSDWTPVTVHLPITHDNHTGLRLEVYEMSVDHTLFVDGAQLY